MKYKTNIKSTKIETAVNEICNQLEKYGFKYERFDHYVPSYIYEEGSNGELRPVENPDTNKGTGYAIIKYNYDDRRFGYIHIECKLVAQGTCTYNRYITIYNYTDDVHDTSIPDDITVTASFELTNSENLIPTVVYYKASAFTPIISATDMCTTCNGTGGIMCTACSGSGTEKIYDDENLVYSATCSECDGIGYIRNLNSLCTDCNGYGYSSLCLDHPYSAYTFYMDSYRDENDNLIPFNDYGSAIIPIINKNQIGNDNNTYVLENNGKLEFYNSNYKNISDEYMPTNVITELSKTTTATIATTAAIYNHTEHCIKKIFNYSDDTECAHVNNNDYNIDDVINFILYKDYNKPIMPILDNITYTTANLATNLEILPSTALGSNVMACNYSGFDTNDIGYYACGTFAQTCYSANKYENYSLYDKLYIDNGNIEKTNYNYQNSYICNLKIPSAISGTSCVFCGNIEIKDFNTNWATYSSTDDVRISAVAGHFENNEFKQDAILISGSIPHSVKTTDTGETYNVWDNSYNISISNSGHPIIIDSLPSNLTLATKIVCIENNTEIERFNGTTCIDFVIANKINNNNIDSFTYDKLFSFFKVPYIDYNYKGNFKEVSYKSYPCLENCYNYYWPEYNNTTEAFVWYKFKNDKYSIINNNEHAIDCYELHKKITDKYCSFDSRYELKSIYVKNEYPVTSGTNNYKAFRLPCTTCSGNYVANRCRTCAGSKVRQEYYYYNCAGFTNSRPNIANQDYVFYTAKADLNNYYYWNGSMHIKVDYGYNYIYTTKTVKYENLILIDTATSASATSASVDPTTLNPIYNDNTVLYRVLPTPEHINDVITFSAYNDEGDLQQIYMNPEYVCDILSNTKDGYDFNVISASKEYINDGNDVAIYKYTTKIPCSFDNITFEVK